MTKSEKYWVFGMIYLLAASSISGETGISIIACVLVGVTGAAYLGMSAYTAFTAKP